MRGDDVRRVLAAVDAEHGAGKRLRSAQAKADSIRISIADNEKREHTMFHRDPDLLETERQEAARELVEAWEAQPAARNALVDLLYSIPAEADGA